jgi:hypothetical protein
MSRFTQSGPFKDLTKTNSLIGASLAGQYSLKAMNASGADSGSRSSHTTRTDLNRSTLNRSQAPTIVVVPNKGENMKVKSKELIANTQSVPPEQIVESNETPALTRETLNAEHLKMPRMGRHVANADNSHLEPMLFGGRVDEVNGAGAEEIPAFNATRHELLQLAKYWAHTVLDVEYFRFISGSIGSLDMRLEPFANRRISRIARFLGQEEVQKVIDEVEREFGKAQDPKMWEIFLHGTSDERAQLQAALQEGINVSSNCESKT